MELIFIRTQRIYPSMTYLCKRPLHYSDVTMGTIASQITSLTIVYSIIYSDADQRKHQSSASLAFVRGIHRGPVSSPHKWPVTRKMFPFDDVIMSGWVLYRQLELSKLTRPDLHHVVGLFILRDVRQSLEYPCALRVLRTSLHGFLGSLVIQSLGICCLRMMGISVK